MNMYHPLLLHPIQFIHPLFIQCALFNSVNAVVPYTEDEGGEEEGGEQVFLTDGGRGGVLGRVGFTHGGALGGKGAGGGETEV